MLAKLIFVTACVLSVSTANAQQNAEDAKTVDLVKSIHDGYRPRLNSIDSRVGKVEQDVSALKAQKPASAPVPQTAPKSECDQQCRSTTVAQVCGMESGVFKNSRLWPQADTKAELEDLIKELCRRPVEVATKAARQAPVQTRTARLTRQYEPARVEPELVEEPNGDEPEVTETDESEGRPVQMAQAYNTGQSYYVGNGSPGHRMYEPHLPGSVIGAGAYVQTPIASARLQFGIGVGGPRRGRSVQGRELNAMDEATLRRLSMKVLGPLPGDARNYAAEVTKTVSSPGQGCVKVDSEHAAGGTFARWKCPRGTVR